MANFPNREPEITRLAQDIAKGLRANPDTFPAPPSGPEDIATALEAYDAARDAAIAASAAALQETKAKEDALNALVEKLKDDLRYAELATRNDAGKLRLLGWGGLGSRTATDIPGQVSTLEVVKEGKTWIQLEWKKPFDGGKVAAYRIQRRDRQGEGEFTDVGTAMETEITLDGQDGGVEWEYRVIAVNKAGEGPVSNVVSAVP